MLNAFLVPRMCSLSRGRATGTRRPSAGTAIHQEGQPSFLFRIVLTTAIGPANIIPVFFLCLAEAPDGQIQLLAAA